MAPKIVTTLIHTFIERSARTKSYGALIQALERQGTALEVRLAALRNSPQNCEKLSHIIGIERWGQLRLQSLLGEPMQTGEYMEYRPAAETGLTSLRVLFAQARANSVALGRKLEEAGVDKSTTVPHNDLGELTVGGWLNYLAIHASREAQRLR